MFWRNQRIFGENSLVSSPFFSLALGDQWHVFRVWSKANLRNSGVKLVSRHLKYLHVRRWTVRMENSISWAFSFSVWSSLEAQSWVQIRPPSWKVGYMWIYYHLYQYDKGEKWGQGNNSCIAWGGRHQEKQSWDK